MKPKVYKSNKSYLDTKKFLTENEYEKMGKERRSHQSKISMTLFVNTRDKSLPEWISEMVDFFDVKDLPKSPESKQYNMIIVIKTEKSVFLIPKGQGFWAVEKIANLDFGLDFAEKTIRNKDISLKSVSYVQRNKMREITNFKKNQNEFPQASESFFYVSGKPESENIFGKSLDCGTAITFSKNFSLSKSKQEKFFHLFNEIDIAMSLEKNKSTIPRLIKVKKKSSLNNELNTIILSDLKSNGQKSILSFDINRIQLVANGINLVDNNYSLKIYLDARKRETERSIELDESSIICFIKDYIADITDINQLRFAIVDEENAIIAKDIVFSRVVYCELEYETKVYVLDNNYWGFFNDRFYELLTEKLTEINEIIKYDDSYSIEYMSEEKGELSGEGGYIEKISESNASFVKLHKRNLNVSGGTIEVADIYDKSKDELIAIKRGTNTSLSMYSLEQSLLSVQVLANAEEFKVKNELQKYNDREKYIDEQKYPNIEETIIASIVQCKRTSVLWLVDNKPEYVHQKVQSKEFKLQDFHSVLLKLKIIDWYSFAKSYGFIPTLYFAMDLPAKFGDVNG